MGLSQFFEYVRNDPSKLDDVLAKMSIVTIDLDATLRDLNTILNLEKGDEVQSEIDLDKLVNEIFDEVNSEIPKAAKVELNKELKIRKIKANRSNLKSILKSLVANGVKFSKDNKYAHVNLKCHYQEEKVIFTVEDNGIGIDTVKNKKRLFELYQRFSPSYAKGRGIGLFLVKSQVHSMKGSIDLKSRLGSGSTFTIQLPQETYIREGDVTVSTRI
jgi:signal transduction histidine kinase